MKKKVNLIDVGVSLAVANGVTQGVFNNNLMAFFTGKSDGSSYRPGSDGGHVMSLPEILGVGLGGRNNKFGGLSAASKENFGSQLLLNMRENAGQLAFSTIAVPMIAKAAKKLLRKPVLTPARKLIKMTGLDVTV
jgi:hypothetical protein